MLSAWALGLGGVAEAALKMALGNRIGARIEKRESPLRWDFGAVLLEWPRRNAGRSRGRTTTESAGMSRRRARGPSARAGDLRRKDGQGVPWRAGRRSCAPPPRKAAGAMPNVLNQRPVALSSPCSPAPTASTTPPGRLIRAGAEPRDPGGQQPDPRGHHREHRGGGAPSAKAR